MIDTLFSLPSVKTPFRYFGGKGYGKFALLPFIPTSVKEIVSPFIGSGSLELALTARGVRVHGYDAFDHLVTAWQEIFTNPNALIPIIRDYIRQFYTGMLNSQDVALDDLPTSAERAAMFICLQNLSFNSFGIHTKISPFEINSDGEPRFDTGARAIKFERITTFYNPLFSVNLADFRDSLAKHPDIFCYADPPYPESACQYGDSPDMNVDFPHEDLASILHNRGKWMLSYNNCDTVKALYPPTDFQYDFPQWRISSKSLARESNCNEVLIRPMW